MANHSTEPSSSLSFTSSSHLSNGSYSYRQANKSPSSSGVELGPPGPLPPPPSANLEVISLNKLSSNLEQLLVDPSCDYSDAVFIVEGTPVGVHRCILAARSKFFLDLFQKQAESLDGKPKYLINDLLPYGKVGYEAFLVFLNYLYTAKLKPSPMEVSTCVDNVCIHDACRPAIHFAVQLMYASSIFQIPELVSLFQVRFNYSLIKINQLIMLTSFFPWILKLSSIKHMPFNSLLWCECDNYGGGFGDCSTSVLVSYHFVIWFCAECW